MATTPQRVTRSKSTSNTSIVSSNTVPGPPIPARDTSTKLDAVHLSNPYQVDLVIPYSIAIDPRDRAKSQNDIKEGYEVLLRALEGEGGLRVASRAGKSGKGKEEVWVFVGAEDEKIEELVEIEQIMDKSHNLPPCSHPNGASPATRIRLLYDLLTSPQMQHGLGITPGKGKWKRVKSIMALHDEEADKDWIEKWTLGGDWKIGLMTDLTDKESEGLARHQPPPVHLYFNFLTTYTLSLLPLSVISILFYFFTAPESYPPLYSIILALYSTIFVAIWRVKERKLAVQWGTKGCESVAVGRLRPEYVANMGLDRPGQKGKRVIDVVRAGDDLKRDFKVAASIPIIVGCGLILGTVIMCIFMLEAFVSHAYDGVGKQVVPLFPTAIFVLVVPQITGLYQRLAKRLVKWEDHPTPVGADKSLTAKTFAMNAIVAYLQLFLSAYVYVPFGPFIMAAVQGQLSGSKIEGESVKFAKTPEQAGLGPKSSGRKLAAIKAGRLRGQLFAYTVNGQVINAFTELVLPYIMNRVDEWRSGKKTIKEVVSVHQAGEKLPKTPEEVEKKFLQKVERELKLPEYSIFTDYAEMVTQFGYVTIWSIVWPLAPLCAFANNYFELRSDAIKITRHVRRPIGDRVETIGSWLETLNVIAWIGAVTNATLIYLFRPSALLPGQSPNPEIPSTGSVYLHKIVSTYDVSPTWKMILPTLVPLAAVALTASHGFIILRWAVEYITEKALWKGSEEEIQIQRLAGDHADVSEQLAKLEKKQYRGWAVGKGFWNGGEEGAREIGRVSKAE